MLMNDPKNKTRQDFPVNTQNLMLNVKPNNAGKTLREKLEANYLKNMANKTNHSSKFPSPTPSHQRLLTYKEN